MSWWVGGEGGNLNLVAASRSLVFFPLFSVTSCWKTVEAAIFGLVIILL